jgi:prefoldin subunit 5
MGFQISDLHATSNLLKEVEALESSQEEIRDSLSKIAERIEQP